MPLLVLLCSKFLWGLFSDVLAWRFCFLSSVPLQIWDDGHGHLIVLEYTAAGLRYGDHCPLLRDVWGFIWVIYFWPGSLCVEPSSTVSCWVRLCRIVSGCLGISNRLVYILKWLGCVLDLFPNFRRLVYLFLLLQEFMHFWISFRHCWAISLFCGSAVWELLVYKHQEFPVLVHNWNWMSLLLSWGR